MNNLNEIIGTLQFLFEHVKVLTDDIVVVRSGDYYGFYNINNGFQSEIAYKSINYDSGMLICTRASCESLGFDTYEKTDIYFINANKLLSFDKRFTIAVGERYMALKFHVVGSNTHRVYDIHTGELMWEGTAEKIELYGSDRFVALAIALKSGDIIALNENGAFDTVENVLKAKFNEVNVNKAKVKINKFTVVDQDGNKFHLNMFGKQY